MALRQEKQGNNFRKRGKFAEVGYWKSKMISTQKITMKIYCYFFNSVQLFGIPIKSDMFSSLSVKELFFLIIIFF